jgi:hypothetical protein
MCLCVSLFLTMHKGPVLSPPALQALSSADKSVNERKYSVKREKLEREEERRERREGVDTNAPAQSRQSEREERGNQSTT